MYTNIFLFEPLLHQRNQERQQAIAQHQLLATTQPTARHRAILRRLPAASKRAAPKSRMSHTQVESAQASASST
jgi:hypothetical protein